MNVPRNEMVSVLLSVLEWEIIVMALTRAADPDSSNTIPAIAGRKVLRHIAAQVQAELPSTT